MDILNTNKYLLLIITLLNFFIGCKEKQEIKPVPLNEFDYIFTIPDKTEKDIVKTKIWVIQKGVAIDSGKFVVSSIKPQITASIKFYNGKKSVTKEDTIKLNIADKKHLITEIQEKPVSRKKGWSPFSSSSQPTEVSFKIDGKLFHQSETLIIK